jgi:acylglycerol lipase
MPCNEEIWSAHDGVKLHAVHWIPNSDPQGAIGLVHGLGEHVGRYAHVADHLNRAGYALFAFDLRGHGKSAGRRGDAPSYETLMDDVGMLVQRVKAAFPALPFFLYGHSMGGNLVLNYVIRRKPRVKGVIVTCPGLKPTSVGPWERRAARILRYIVPTVLIANQINPADLSRDPEVVQKYMTDSLVHNKVSLRLSVSVIDAGAWVVRHAEMFDRPLLFLQGGADKVVDVEANVNFARNVSGLCCLKLWPGLYHEIHNEPEKEQVLDELVAWLDSHVQ